MLTTADLPALNASLNFVSTVFIAFGWYSIRRGFWRRHVTCMIAALLTSTGFLVSYVAYHVAMGGKSTRLAEQAIVRPIYFFILITHVLWSMIIVPLVMVTLVPVIQRRWDRHRRLGKWTMPVWLYVSVTGVLVYLMLYRWFPPADLALPR